MPTPSKTSAAVATVSRGRCISDVAHHHASIAAGGVYQAQGFVQSGGRPTDTNDSGATGRELSTQRLSQATSGPGDDRHLILEPLHALPPLGWRITRLLSARLAALSKRICPAALSAIRKGLPSRSHSAEIKPNLDT